MSVEFANRTLEGELGRKANSRALKPTFGGPTSTWYVRVQSSPSSGPDALPASDFLYLTPYTSAPWCLWWALCIWIKPFPIAIRAFQTVFRPGNPFLPKLGIQQNLTQNATEQNRWRQNCCSWKGPTPPPRGLFSTHRPPGSGIWKPLTSADPHTEALLFFPSPQDLGQTPLETTVGPLPKGQTVRREHQQRLRNQDEEYFNIIF